MVSLGKTGEGYTRNQKESDSGVLLKLGLHVARLLHLDIQSTPESIESPTHTTTKKITGDNRECESKWKNISNAESYGRCVVLFI